MDREALLERARGRGVNPLVYWLVRGGPAAVLPPVLPPRAASGASTSRPRGRSILASNHRSFLDPFVIGMMARRPLYFLAKKELFAQPVRSPGCSTRSARSRSTAAPPTRRRWPPRARSSSAATACSSSPRARARAPARSARPKRGVGRLALETGAPVVPVAVIGTEAVRRGWRIRPHKVRIRAGAPLTFPRVEHAQPPARRRGHRAHLAVRRAAVGVAGRHAARSAAPPSSARGALGHRPGRRARARRRRGRARHARARRAGAPTVETRCPTRPPCSPPTSSSSATTTSSASPSPPRELPAVVAAHGARIPERAGVLVRDQGPRAAARHAALRLRRRARAARAVACLGGPAHAGRRARRTAPRSCVACADASLRRPRSPTCCARAASTVQRTTDVDRRRARRRRQERRRRSPPPPPRPPGRTPPGRRRARSSPRSTPTRAATAASPRRSPAWPAPATWSPRSSPGARRPAAARRRVRHAAALATPMRERRVDAPPSRGPRRRSSRAASSAERLGRGASPAPDRGRESRPPSAA